MAKPTLNIMYIFDNTGIPHLQFFILTISNELEVRTDHFSSCSTNNNGEWLWGLVCRL